MVRNEKILNDIILKMSYDPSKTLSENVKNITVSTITEQKEASANVYAIPGYTTYYGPTVGAYPRPNTSSFYYFPDGENNITFWDSIPLPTDFGTYEKSNEIVRNWNESGNPPKFDEITAENLGKIIQIGDVRNFRNPNDGKTYHARIRANKDTNGHWVFVGYISNDGTAYVQPNPDDYKSWWEKFVEEWGTTFQIIAGIIAIIAIEYFTAGLGTSLAMRIALEIGAELLINIPVSIAERSLGDDAAANLSIAFSFLPLLNAGVLRSIGIMKQVPKEVAESLSNKMAKKTITSGEDLAKFYDELEDPFEKYVFSRVIKQPAVVSQGIESTIKNALKDGKFNKDVLKRLAFKDRDWWKEAGLQFSTAMALVIGKSMTTHTYTEQEFERMNSLVAEIVKSYGDEAAQTFTSYSIENPQDTIKVVNALTITDTTSREGKQTLKEASEILSNGINIKFKESWKLLNRARLDSIKNAENITVEFDPSWFDNPQETNDVNPEEGNEQPN